MIEKKYMRTKERFFIITILLGISIFAIIDLISDFKEGTTWWHLMIEGIMALTALVGVFYLLRGSFTLRRSLEQERNTSTRLKAEAEKWREESKKYVDGLSQSIDVQLTKWGLTSSEKDVAFLLLKGLSFKEIADARKTSERTARTQSSAIYAKSGLAGRSELSAFFLEDLLLPV